MVSDRSGNPPGLLMLASFTLHSKAFAEPAMATKPAARNATLKECFIFLS
jgi:hypothetical protein